MKHKKSTGPTPKQSKMIQDALVLHQSGQLEAAETQYKRILERFPSNTDILTNLGTLAFQKGELEEAISIIEKSLKINPNQPYALNNRGTALQKLKRLTEALTSYDNAIVLKPDYVDAYYNRGNILKDLKQLDEALASYDNAIALKPEHHQSYCNRGIILQKLNRLDEALISYDRAIELKPNYAEAYFNRGVVFQDLKQLNEALASYDMAIGLNPNYAEAHSNRGNTLKELNRFDEALVSYERAIKIKPDYDAAYSNRGSVLQDLKQLNEALASYDRAIELKPDYAEAHWNKALLKILNGDYLEGWQLYEWGWKSLQRKPLRQFNTPLWLGNESLVNKTLLIYPEQGLGDYIQFIRYAVLAEQLGAKVILEVPLPLLTLTSTLKGQFTLIEHGKPLPAFDYHCPVMSLPLAFKTTVETIPAQLPFLYADDHKKQHWHKKLGQKTLTRIGLVWSGSTVHKNDHNRSLLLQQLTPLLELPLEFHSLQKEVRKIDENTLTNFPNIHQHQDQLLDFSDTAALVDAMDIIISVDTSVAHLAGAMGKKVWVLLPYSPDYRWMLDKINSPWYPSATLFRQPTADDWASVVTKIKELLAN